MQNKTSSQYDVVPLYQTQTGTVFQSFTEERNTVYVREPTERQKVPLLFTLKQLHNLLQVSRALIIIQKWFLKYGGDLWTLVFPNAAVNAAQIYQN